MVFMEIDWMEVQLKDICENKTATCKIFDLEGIERFVGLEHIKPENLNISSWGDVNEGTTFTKLFYPGQVLFGKRRSYQKKAAVADFKGVCSGDILVLEAKSEIILPGLLPYIIQNDRLFDFAVSTSSGSLSPRTSWKHISAFKIKIPKSMKEQKFLLNKFLLVEQALILKEKLIDNTHVYKNKLMQQLLTRGISHKEFKNTEFGKIPQEWEVANLYDHLKSVLDFRGKTPKKLGMEWGNGEIPALSANNVKMGYIDFAAECYLGSNELYQKWMTKGDLEKGDVLMTMEAPLGKVAQVPDNNKYILSQRVIAFKTKETLSNNFLKYYLMSNIFQSILESSATGTTAKGINQKNLSQLRIVVPSLEEQQKITSILSTLDKQIEIFENEKEMTISIKKSLQEKLLSPREGVRI